MSRAMVKLSLPGCVHIPSARSTTSLNHYPTSSTQPGGPAAGTLRAPAEHNICAELKVPSYARHLESASRRPRKRGPLRLPQMQPVVWGRRCSEHFPIIDSTPFRKILPLNHLPDTNTDRARSRTRTRGPHITSSHEPQLELDRALGLPDVFPGGPARSSRSLLINRYPHSTELCGLRTLFRRPGSSAAIAAHQPAPAQSRSPGTFRSDAAAAEVRIPHTTLHLRKAQVPELRSAP